MKVGWLVDDADMTGGAELTQAEFRAAAPDGVEIVDCPAGEIVAGLDRYVVHNNVQYTLADMEQIDGPCVRYWHDVGPHLQPGVREWLGEHATPICCSPIQAEYMALERALCIPPPVDLERFEQAAAKANGDRRGAVCVGSWRNFGKAPHKAAEWAAGNGGIDFYGGGIAAPHGSRQIAYEDMPALLARYATFVFLPMVIEPFSRTVVEAWAAGCEIVTNGLVGARYWIEENPEAMDTAAEDFWAVVLA
jgi:glycosyltransferase involved in cell wall biosynthesis